LAPIPTIIQFSGDADEQAKGIKKLHEQIRGQIEKKMKSIVRKPISIESQ
jgi:hypothetical protein